MALLSDFEGKAIKIAVATPGDVDATRAHSLLRQQLGNLPGQLHPDCQIFWVHRSTNGTIAPFKIDGRAIVPVPLYTEQPLKGHMRWIQDPFVCLQQHAGVTLLLPANTDEIGRETVRALSRALDCPVQHTDLHLEGGNILQLGDTLLLGKDLAYQNGIPQQSSWLKPDREAWTVLEGKLKVCFHAKKIVWVGTKHQMELGLDCTAVARCSWQPLFHLDLFVMPGGISEAGHLRLFLGEVDCWEQIGLGNQGTEAIKQLKLALEEVKSGLTEAIPNVQIARLPILAAVQSGRLSIDTMCNGWVEAGRNLGGAFLPDFGRNARKDAYAQDRHTAHLNAEQPLAAWGLKCQWVDMDLGQLSTEGGALHCSTKILERTF